jgi:hypothetical protein
MPSSHATNAWPIFIGQSFTSIALHYEQALCMYVHHYRTWTGSRVTGLGEFSPFLHWANFSKLYENLKFFVHYIPQTGFVDIHGFGNILGDFFMKASGHPEFNETCALYIRRAPLVKNFSVRFWPQTFFYARVYIGGQLSKMHFFIFSDFFEGFGRLTGPG